MTLHPRQVHALEQLGGALRETAQLLAAYHAELRAGGMPEAEAWALTQQLEERLLGPAVDAAAGTLAPERHTQ